MTCPQRLHINDGPGGLPCTSEETVPHALHVYMRDGQRVATWIGNVGPEHLCQCAHPEPGPCLRCEGEIR